MALLVGEEMDSPVYGDLGKTPHPPPCPGHSLGGGQQHLLLGAHAPLPITLSWKMELLETEKCLKSFPCKHGVYSSYRAVL